MKGNDENEIGKKERLRSRSRRRGRRSWRKKKKEESLVTTAANGAAMDVSEIGNTIWTERKKEE